MTTTLQHRAAPLIPGLAVAAAIALAAMVVSRFVPVVSPLLITMIVGIVWRNVAPVPDALEPGTKVAATPILRAGIVLLGLQIAIGDVLTLGWVTVLAIVVAVFGTFTITAFVGKRLGVPRELRLLIASGFSICGAAAVAGAKSVTRADEDDTATAVALVVLFGTVMIPLTPAVAALLQFDANGAGTFIGLTTHEVAQVVAAGGIAGGGALSVAVVTKLGRVLLLAPMLALLAASARGPAAPRGFTTFVPPFVLGFAVCVALRSTGMLPGPLLDAAGLVQTFALAMAMLALGLHVHLGRLRQLGPKPLVLGGIATASILLIGLGAVALSAALGR